MNAPVPFSPPLPPPQVMASPLDDGYPYLPRRVPWSIKLLALYLMLITIFGKGPTYIGIHPVYLGEVVLVCMLLWTVSQVSRFGLPPSFRAAATFPVFMFVTYGLFRTLPDIPEWGMDALRDAAIWYYALFFFIGLYLPRAKKYADYVASHVHTAWFLIMIWVFMNKMTNSYFIRHSPRIRSGSFLLSGSTSENIQNLFMGILVVLLGLRSRPKSLLGYIFSLSLIGFSFYACFTVYGRGVKLAILGAFIIGFLSTFGAKRSIWPTSRWLIVLYLTICLMGTYTIYLGPDGLTKMLYARTGAGRFEEAADMKGTANWRMRWWTAILDELHEKAPAVGLGFGLNLHDLSPDPFVNPSQYEVRSPHCFSMTVLGRMGYIGLGLWGIILLTGIVPLLLKIRSGGKQTPFGEFLPYRKDRHKELLLWLMFLIATVINASFAVLMEGPVLGIWFWFALGFAHGRATSPDGFETPAPETSAGNDSNAFWMGAPPHAPYPRLS